MEWKKGKWYHTLPVQRIFSISAYTGSNSPLTLVCTSITFTCFTKLLLRFSWKGNQSHSPFCWLCYALPAILVLTLQGGYWSLHVITMWSQKIDICQRNCTSKWCAKWMQNICATFKNQNPTSSEQKSVVMWKWVRLSITKEQHYISIAECHLLPVGR